MTILKSSIVWGMFNNTEFLITSQRKELSGERSGYLGGQGETRFTLTPSVIPNFNYVIMVSD
jgi:hypothetical protein